MAFTKITPADTTGKGVIGLPDTPELSSTDMQEKFDELVLDVIVPKFNNLVDEITDAFVEEGGDIADVAQALTDEVARAQGAEGDLSDAITTLDGAVMKKATYDSDNDGVVDNSELLNGHADSYFATAQSVSDLTTTVNGKMTRSTYDADNDGVVDNAEALGGHSASYFATASALSDEVSRAQTAEGGKVDKVAGKGLSTNDFTTAYKNQIDTNKSNIGDLSDLTTTAKDNLVEAINEAAQSGGGASDLDDLTDVTISNPADGQGIFYDATTQKWVNKGSNVKVDDVSSASASASGKNITLTWSDPSDVVAGDTTLAEWAGTKVVRKVGSAPQNINDGTVVVNNTVKDQYSSTGYVDTAPNIDTTYYYRFFPYTTEYNYTEGSSVNATTEALIYGVEWDGSSTTAWSRTDDAVGFTDPSPAVNNGNGSSPFDTISPWKDIRRVTDSNAGELVEIPKFYYKWTRSGSSMKLQISMSQKEGFLCSPAHADRGDNKGERDYVYVGRYHCSSSDYKSTTGVLSKSYITRSTARTAIHNLGSDIWQFDYAMLWTIRMLYLVEYADWNSQAKIGYGCGDGDNFENTGSTDAMTYHTGTNAASRDTYGHTQYRYIEDLWGNVYDWCDGIYFSGTTIYGIKNPADFSDSTGGTNIGTRANTSNCIQAWTNPSTSGFEYALYPSAVVSDKNYATYVADRYNYATTDVGLYVGGYVRQNQGSGLFCVIGGVGTYSNDSTGSRLMKLP